MPYSYVLGLQHVWIDVDDNSNQKNMPVGRWNSFFILTSAIVTGLEACYNDGGMVWCANQLPDSFKWDADFR